MSFEDSWPILSHLPAGKRAYVAQECGLESGTSSPHAINDHQSVSGVATLIEHLVDVDIRDDETVAPEIIVKVRQFLPHLVLGHVTGSDLIDQGA